MNKCIYVVAGILASVMTCGIVGARTISADSPSFLPNACSPAICTPYLGSTTGLLQIAPGITNLASPTTSPTYQLRFAPGTSATRSAAGVLNAVSGGNCDYSPQYTSAALEVCYAYMFNWGADPANQAVAVESQVMIFQYQDGQTGVFPGADADTVTFGAFEVDFNYTATKCKGWHASFTVSGTTYKATNPCAAGDNAFFFNVSNDGSGNEQLVLIGGVPSGWSVEIPAS